MLKDISIHRPIWMGFDIVPACVGRTVRLTDRHSHDDSIYRASIARPDLRGEANWAVAQGPPQLRGLHKKQ